MPQQGSVCKSFSDSLLSIFLLHFCIEVDFERQLLLLFWVCLLPLEVPVPTFRTVGLYFNDSCCHLAFIVHAINTISFVQNSLKWTPYNCCKLVNLILFMIVCSLSTISTVPTLSLLCLKDTALCFPPGEMMPTLSPALWFWPAHCTPKQGVVKQL